ncbi:hypothetical protein CALCODRAFT_189006 [Calocera cornea HHB12733]|uniref:Uncharacterized protein n=1 Tax=Calocera cornea HHB12733 TaxID=1353952 RepID=A0A165C8T6_9BASI|nr:hypothetical protein CALCODRAFT_189006 [Calocera cornea HHB12733]
MSPSASTLSKGELLRTVAKEEVDTILEYLGLNPGSSLRRFELGRLLRTYNKYTPAHKEAIFSRLAAGYLPLLAARLITMSSVMPLWSWVNDFFVMLQQIDESAHRYLHRFMQLPHSIAKQLPIRIVELTCVAIQKYGHCANSKEAVENIIGVGELLLTLFYFAARFRPIYLAQ